ncbi:hypothetical protein [Vibrio sp. TBV020]|uniref:hypothetical protein n=1 Tax=Vibrio sp. TBV020 TaxID=3137398 RepID=UPI0038CD67A4
MSQDIKKQVVSVCETLYASGVELKKITGRLVAKDTEFSHTSVTPFVKEWRESQYKIEADELKKTSMSEPLVKALHQEIHMRMQSLNALRDDEMETNRQELTDALDNALLLNKQVKELEEKLLTANDKNIQMQRDIATKEQELSTLQATVSRLESDKVEMKESFEQQIQELETRLDIQEKEHNTALTAQKDEHLEQVTELKSEHTQRITELSQSHSHHLDELKTAHDSAQRQLRSDIEKLETELKASHIESSSKSETIGQLRSELEDKEQIKQQILQRDTDNRELSIKLSSAEQSAQTATDALSKVETELLDHKQQRNNAQTELATLSTKFEDLTNKYTTLLVENAK